MPHNDEDCRQLFLAVNTLQIEVNSLKDRVKEDRDRGEHLMESLAKEVKELEACVRSFKALYEKDKARVEGAMWTSGRFWVAVLGAASLGVAISKLL